MTFTSFSYWDETRVITLSNLKRQRLFNGLIKLKVNIIGTKHGKLVRERHDWFRFISDWMKKWREIFLGQSCSVVTQNQSKCELVLSTLK